MGKRLIWEDRFKTGVEVIDNQHKILFDLANDLNNASNTGANMQVMDTLFTVITNYAFTHFETEEGYFKGDKNYLEHCHHHYQLIKKLFTYSSDFHNNRQGDVDPGTFMYEWLVDHITHTDIPTFDDQPLELHELEIVDILEEVDDSALEIIEQRANKRLSRDKILDDDIAGHCFNANKSESGMATILDLSTGGLKISSKNKHNIDDLLVITANIGKNFRMKEKVQVRNVDESGNYGVEFIALSHDTKTFLTQLIGATAHHY